MSLISLFMIGHDLKIPKVPRFHVISHLSRSRVVAFVFVGGIDRNICT